MNAPQERYGMLANFYDQTYPPLARVSMGIQEAFQRYPLWRAVLTDGRSKGLRLAEFVLGVQPICTYPAHWCLVATQDLLLKLESFYEGLFQRTSLGCTRVTRATAYRHLHGIASFVCIFRIASFVLIVRSHRSVALSIFSTQRYLDVPR